MSNAAAIDLLAQMLTGIQHPSFLSEDEPTLSMEAMAQEGDKVSAILTRPSGDRYRLSVEWLREESP